MRDLSDEEMQTVYTTMARAAALVGMSLTDLDIEDRIEDIWYAWSSEHGDRIFGITRSGQIFFMTHGQAEDDRDAITTAYQLVFADEKELDEETMERVLETALLDHVDQVQGKISDLEEIIQVPRREVDSDDLN